MSSNAASKTKDRENNGLVRRSLRSLSFRSNKRKKKDCSGVPVDGDQNKLRYRHSEGDISRNNNGAIKPAVLCSGIAVLPFTAILSCDLTFNAGDRINILTRTDTWYDWWEGEINGRVGIFPANYVKIVDRR